MTKVLSTDIEFFAAALSQTNVVVCKDEMNENAGVIREYCDKFLRIGDSWFSRSLYDFHIITR
ncbi:hypothetical protein [Paenibacillus sp. WC2504]|uniref:hypothetical protein n=1 Tax=Paenibacillus sp. WC2504 TaxID=3461403 RepID=UPI004045DA9B